MKKHLLCWGVALALLGMSMVAGAEGASAPVAGQRVVVATASAPAVVAPPMAVSAPATTESAYPAPTWVVVLVFGTVLGFLLISLSAVRRSLANDPDWKLAHALSEELDTPPPTPPASGATGVTPPVAPVLVGSSSRLIAFMGMLVIMAFFTGVGLWLLWSLLRTGQVPDMDRLVNFFYGGAMLFAPYMVNQLRAALGSLK